MSVSEDRGLIRSIDLADPAAGAEYADQTVPTNAFWKIRGFAGQLVADATAAKRHFSIEVTDGTVIVGSAGIAIVSQEASSTRDFRGAPGLVGGWGDSAGSGGTQIQHIAVALSRIGYPQAYVLDFTTSNLVAGDNWGDGQLLVEEWIED